MTELLMQIMMESPTSLMCDDVSLVYDEDTGAWVVMAERTWRFEDFNEALQHYATCIGMLLLVVA